jgi:Ca-activated chloride channel homolog
MRKSLALAVGILLGLPGAAQQQGDAPARIKSRTELVIVPVTVKDSHGNLVSGIGRDEFRIFEDGVEQPVALFSNDAFPLSAVILLDNDLNSKAADEVQQSLMSIAAGFGPLDEVSLMLYAQFPEPVLDFTRDSDKLFTQLKRLRLNSTESGPGESPSMSTVPIINGQTVGGGPPPTVHHSIGTDKNLDDALHAAGELLHERGRDRRKIIFLISDGANSHGNTWSIEATTQLLLSADISVYSVAVSSSFLKHGTGRLEKYARETGGDYFYASRHADLERLYSALTEQARNQYTLAFVPQKTDRSKDYHTIEVRVRRADLDLLTRQGYYTAAVAH